MLRLTFEGDGHSKENRSGGEGWTRNGTQQSVTSIGQVSMIFSLCSFGVSQLNWNNEAF